MRIQSLALGGAWLTVLVGLACCGCHGADVRIDAQVPPPSHPADALAAVALDLATESVAKPAALPKPEANKGEKNREPDEGKKPELLPRPKPSEGEEQEHAGPPRKPAKNSANDDSLDDTPKKPTKSAFELPPGLPGADAPSIQPPKFDRDAKPAEREKAIRKVYPQVQPLPAVPDFGGAKALSLAELQKLAANNSPVLRRALADSDAAEGEVIQAGLPPNPTVGYEGDQVQPGSNFGQQGVYVNQLLKRPGKLTLARAVSAFDHLNAQIAVRRANVDVATQVRSAYFGVVNANKGLEVNRALATLADEVYGLQLKQLAAGEAAGYEPLQLYAQSVQARNSLTQSLANARASWKQLAAAVGQPDLPCVPLAGRADALPPLFDAKKLEGRLMHHTDLLTAHNSLLQAKVNLELQELTPRPDLQTNTVVQYDTVGKKGQFNLQLGVALPVCDKNQGNIFKARAQIGRATENINALRNELIGRLAEALGRYESNESVARNIREGVIPNLTRAYRGIIRRYQAEPERVGFNDIVVAQQNLAQALQGYLTALEGQWRAVVDVANLVQLDDLYGPVDAPRAVGNGLRAVPPPRNATEESL